MQRIEFHYETDFSLDNELNYHNWIVQVVESEKYRPGNINYIFCDDQYLLRLHNEYLSKDNFTDIITFDYSEGNEVSGDVFISVERVMENSNIFNSGFEEELLRVMSHGLLHMMNYSDKAAEDQLRMRGKENEKIEMFHVEQ